MIFVVPRCHLLAEPFDSDAGAMSNGNYVGKLVHVDAHAKSHWPKSPLNRSFRSTTSCA